MKTSAHVRSDSPKSWELGGESVIHGETVPAPPVSGGETTVRLTHSNAYGPMDDVTFFVRVGSLQSPTAFEDLDAATDWRPMTLVAESVWLDGEERSRSELGDALDPRAETPWAGTFEGRLELAAGKQRIELKVVSTGHLQSGVISDWRVKVM